MMQTMEKLERYLNQLEPSAEFLPTLVTKQTYLDLLEIVFHTYSADQIYSRTKFNGEYMDLQTYSRLTSVLACLLSGGRVPEHRGLLERMMSECCKEIQLLQGDVISDFAVKEIMLAYKLIKKRASVNKLEEWREALSRIDPFNQYLFTIRDVNDEKMTDLHNINVYNMVGEFLRETEGLTDSSSYFAVHWPYQLKKFDAYGMYMDPGCPMLYDLTTRCQIQLMMKHGYEGPFAEQLDGKLAKAGLMTLFTQSSAYEFPYGGRSNQFLFNEALIAANCEFEAVRYKKKGNPRIAGAFKRSGHLAVIAVKRWLDIAPPRHIKNFYPIESRWGTEAYGYYDKYMITFGAFLALAYYFADDSIAEAPCPAERGGYVLETSEHFHKIFAGAGGYSIEVDTKADLKYDATGLGRIHRSSIPTELGLSSPLSMGDAYELNDGIGRVFGSISPGWENRDGGIQFLSEISNGINKRLAIFHENVEFTEFMLEISGLQSWRAIRQLFKLSEEGVQIHIELVEPAVERVYLQLPLLVANGMDKAGLHIGQNAITVTMGRYQYKAVFDGRPVVSETVYGNRNGEYRIATIQSEGRYLSLKLQLIDALKR
ncbi:hypothetical protein AB6A23_06720 [Paenibacillus tarimensis]